MKIPVDKRTTDPFYRYKMDSIRTKVEGRGNGIKTVLVNLDDIARTLKRHPECMLKYMSYVVGVQCKREKRGDKFVLSGAHCTETMQNLIYDYIEEYVICTVCGNPETFYVLDNGLFTECYACGHKNRLAGRLVNTIAKYMRVRDCGPSYKQKVEEVIDDDVRYPAATAPDDVLQENHCDDSVSTRVVEEIFGEIPNRNWKEKDVLPLLEVYLVKNEQEGKVCLYLDYFIKGSYVRKSDVFTYFRTRSKVVDKASSTKIRSFLRSYFD